MIELGIAFIVGVAVGYGARAIIAAKAPRVAREIDRAAERLDKKD